MPTNFDLSLGADIFSWASILLGSFFVLTGSLGLLRMPDIFTRMHAASITDTVGAGFLIVGMIGQAGLTLVTLKLVFILLLLAITSPVASHALAQAALHENVEPILAEDRRDRPLIDDLPQTEQSKDHKSKGADQSNSAKTHGGTKS